MFKCHPTAGDEDQTAEEEEQQGAPVFLYSLLTKQMINEIGINNINNNRQQIAFEC